jgi:hypothetical protein
LLGAEERKRRSLGDVVEKEIPMEGKVKGRMKEAAGPVSGD